MLLEKTSLFRENRFRSLPDPPNQVSANVNTVLVRLHASTLVCFDIWEMFVVYNSPVGELILSLCFRVLES